MSGQVSAVREQAATQQSPYGRVLKSEHKESGGWDRREGGWSKGHSNEGRRQSRDYCKRGNKEGKNVKEAGFCLQ